MFLTKAEGSVTVDDAGARDRRTDDQSARDDDHDVVAEAFEGLIGRHDADRHRDKQGEHGDEVVAPAAPGEQPHHGDDDGEDEALIERHLARRA